MPQGWLGDTAILYARVFRQGAALALRNWAVGLVVIVYGMLVSAGTVLTASFGIVGGLILYLVVVACASSWLSLVREVVRTGRVHLRDLPAGFTAHLSDLLTVFFLVWALSLVASLVLGPFPYLRIVFVLASFVFLNAVPELVYLGGRAPAELLVESYRFIGENWIEWFPANVVLLGCVAAVRMLPDVAAGLLVETATGVALYFAMIVRGLLFQELASSSRRGRAFRRRAAG